MSVYVQHHDCPECGADLIDSSTNFERKWVCALCEHEVYPDR